MLLEFSWGADRQHRVVSEVLIDPIRTHQLRVTEDDFPVVLGNLESAINNAESAISKLEEAKDKLDDACGCEECHDDCNDCDPDTDPDCTNPCSDCCDVDDYCEEAKELLQDALDYEADAEAASVEAWEGIQIECRSYISFIMDDPIRYHEKIIGWVYDILAPEGGATHPREVFSRNEQFHQGNTGQESSDLYELEDVSIESSAVATWNYEDRGYICFTDCEDCTPIWEHDASIILIEE
ncbi:MAG: hypothetical protein GF375_01910 [Candidatus Omnitrophica bacterium]|nr:hypothetical protein [Candidatus Omnitrophota bacterium]MBD3268881.1 hypothetical protein [Candidatus Omnitrophota bacterium]